MRTIIKAELLWTRLCPLSCSYCSMKRIGGKNKVSKINWFLTIDQLKKLDCKFIAFYGAEPLYDFENLSSVVGYSENNDIKTTVITSGCVQNFTEKIEELYKAGLRSLSMSYDMIPLDFSSRLKSEKAIYGLKKFQSFGAYRDVALIITLTRINYEFLIPTIKKYSEEDMWVFFDIIHPDRNQLGSKCRSFSGIDELLFRPEDYFTLQKKLEEVLELKNQGYKCHTSKEFIKKLIKNNFRILKKYSWSCADEFFPSWVSIDCDGVVYPCDDFNFKDDFIIYGWEIFDRFNDFSSYWKTQILKLNCGCCWNTHIDAHNIKAGCLSFRDYIHEI